jgi:hypothetical protein
LHEEFASRSAQQAKELREAHARMQRLEAHMGDLALAIDTERQTMQQRLDDYRRQAAQQITKLNDVSAG